MVRNWATLVAAIGALLAFSFAAYHYMRQRAFELLKHIEDNKVRDARRRIMLSLPLPDSVSWVECDEHEWQRGLNIDAATVCASYNNLAAFVLPKRWFSGLFPFSLFSKSLMNFFIDNWGESIVRSHSRLLKFLSHRRSQPLQKDAYRGFSELALRVRQRRRISCDHLVIEIGGKLHTQEDVEKIYKCASPLTT